ncbi:MAG: hypothetical protein CMJ75_01185 [Planctomycetaceae bacterium]|nr:hypothetical protein [Planctomycetaceae bacterium]
MMTRSNTKIALDCSMSPDTAFDSIPAQAPRQIPLPDVPPPTTATPVKSNGCRNLMIGCGCLAAVAIPITLAGTIWAVFNWRFMLAQTGTLVIKTAIRELQIPPDQRQRINQRIDQLAQQYTDGDLSGEQLGQIVENITTGPLLPAGSALVVERQYLDDSGLDATEKEAARQAIQRFAYGSLNESIPADTFSEVLDTISDTDGPEGQRTFRQSLSDDELRGFIAAAVEAADAAGVPTEVPDVNFADEFDKAVDEALDPATRSP